LFVLGAEFMTLSFQILPDITVDHPFLAFVVDEINNIPLFAARVADPSQL
jgi:serine protease inhibitor